MEYISLTEDIRLMGVHVKDFPAGVERAFTALMQQFGQAHRYYGVSWMDDEDRVVYYAMAEETQDANQSTNHYESILIEKGEYRCETLHNWMSQTDCIKDIFHRLTEGQTPSRVHPCIEWYKSDDELICMVRS